MEMDIQESSKEQLLSPTANDQLFNAEDGEQNNATLDNDDDDFLKKLDEAINDESVSNVTESVNEPPSKKVCLDKLEGHDVDETDIRETSLEDIEKLLKEEDTLLKEDDKDEIKNDVETLIDVKSVNELLKGLDDDYQNSEINNEFEGILSSIQNEESSTININNKNKNGDDVEKKSEETLEKSILKAGELTREESNELLLELCESPTTVQDEQLSNDTGSNQEDSNEEESSESDKNKEEEMQDEPTVTEKLSDNNINLDNLSSSQLSALKTDDNEQKETIESDKSGQNEAQSANESDNFKVPESKKLHDEKMEVDDSSSECVTESEEGVTESESDCVTKSESRETISSSEETAETFDSSSQEQQQQEKDEQTPIKKQVMVKLNFMRKFASSFGKLSRSDLEELLLEKITESIVFRSESTDLRTKCEKQDEIIENLKQRIQSITKQYNDLDMIHKRIVKDLKEKPDQPITPVKITRAVGLQVYQPHNNSNNINNLKPKVTSTTTVANKPTVKRPNESSDINEKEAEAKRKKSNKIITPMRPPLSEKEKASLEKQEATIEQKIRTKVIKSDAASLPSSTKPTSNGMIKIQSSERNQLSSTQSIDLTDEDDSPSSIMTQQPPALVAIQKNNFMSPRGFRPASSSIRGSSPNILNRQSFTRHPAPLPQTPVQQNHPSMKKIPPRPTIKINNVQNGIIVSWTVDTLTSEHAEIHSYQIYAYEETRSVSTTESWKHVGDVKALLLPMAVTLTQFQEGQKYHFAVRAVDIHRRVGQFSQPKTW